jgi:hypothetical protein
MKLLVSPMSLEEAKNSVLGGADIIDVKRPLEGALGANFPVVIRKIKEILPERIPLSATVGDCYNIPGMVSQAAVGAAFAGADYVKIGLYDIKTTDEAAFLLKKVTENVNYFFSNTKIIAAVYADFSRIGSIPPHDILEVASSSGCTGVLIDTAIKDGSNLFTYLDPKFLKKFIKKASDFSLLTALAGNLNVTHIELLKELAPNIIGIRSAVCVGDRINGRITRDSVEKFVALIKG